MAEKKLSAGNRSHAKFSPKQAHLSSNRAVCCMWGPQLPTKTLAPYPRTFLLAHKLGKTAQNATCISKSSTVRKTHFQKKANGLDSGALPVWGVQINAEA